MHKTSPFTLVAIISVIAAVTGLLFGFDTGIISGALLFIEKDFTLTTVMKEMIVSSVLLGAMVGSLCCGHLADLLGRRKLLLIVAICFVAGTLIASLAPSVHIILVGRLLIGLAIGIGSYTAPLYIAEIAPADKRGALVSLNQLAITMGILVSYLINFAFTQVEGSWRWMFAFGLIPAILLSIGMIFLPESPRWLVKQNLLDKAKIILMKFRNNASEVDAEIAAIQHSLKVKKASFKEVFAPWVRPVLFLGMMLGLIQQISGINTIIYYAPTIFKMAGFANTANAILATVGIGVVNVLATIFAVRYLDTLGRRPLLLTGLVGMFICLSGLGWVFHVQSHMLQALAIFFIFVYIICFAFSLGALLWLMVSEIFPLEVRGTAMGIAVFSCWFWNFVVSSTFLSLLNKVGPSMSFFFYAAMCALSYYFCYLKVPETSGVSLEQIEENIRKGLPLRKLGK